MTTRHLAITMGDPAGIGPEIIVKAAARLRDRLAAGTLKLLIVGSNVALERARAAFAPDLEAAPLRVEAHRRAVRQPVDIVDLQIDEHPKPTATRRLSTDIIRLAGRSF